ncbi:MAG: serine hydroxymethyltransferase [Planctomycetes bacterium]|nr:serine hydroxymethyltransferase [Planctomycetota bacterium]
MDHLSVHNPTVAAAIVAELRDQRRNVKLIASENYASLATQLAMGNLFTDKYAEGYPGHRFYSGCENVDRLETEAVELAKSLFGAEHAYVQPHSGATANLVAFLAILSWKVQRPLLEEIGEEDPNKVEAAAWVKVREAMSGQRMLAMDLASGGHLTHGYRHNVSSLLFDAHSYGVDPVSHLVDYDVLRARAQEVKPLVLIAGYSAYPRKLNFAKIREIADEVGAVLMVDMAHFAGLVAGRQFTGDFDPVPHAHLVTSTTHKTLRGPRGGLILCKAELAEFVNRGCPAVIGGPLPHVMASKAVAFREAGEPGFEAYSAKIIENAQALAGALLERGVKVISGGTDNHIVLVNVSETFGITGRQAETALRECSLTLNRNTVPPSDENGPWYTSGLRFGTSAVTTLGMGPAEMVELAEVISAVLAGTEGKEITKGKKKGQRSRAKYVLPDEVRQAARERIEGLLPRFPVYPELDLELLLSGVQAD